MSVVVVKLRCKWENMRWRDGEEDRNFWLPSSNVTSISVLTQQNP